MKPTPRLRFVERKVGSVLNGNGNVEVFSVRKVLQQWWAYDIEYPTQKGEWKDVPLEKETDVKTF